MSLQNQAALVTGASRGIGKEIALELARRGCRVAVNYYNDPVSLVDATVAEIRALHAEVLPIEADIRSSSQVTAMFERVIGAFGRLDYAIIDRDLDGLLRATQVCVRFREDSGPATAGRDVPFVPDVAI